MPNGYEGQETTCEIVSGNDYIEFDEYFYELKTIAPYCNIGERYLAMR